MDQGKKNDDFYDRPPELSGWQAFKQFLWNPKSHEILGRTGKSWFQILIFYVILYAFLAGFFASMLMIFYQTLDADKPRWQLDGSRIGVNPGMGYRPNNVEPDNLPIIFNMKDPKSFETYIQSIDNFLQKYNDQPTDSPTYINCKPGSMPGADELCRVPLDIPVDCIKEKDYGFSAGSPCFFLKLNKVFGWLPEPYMDEDISSNERIPKELVKKIQAITDINERTNNVWVWCEGEGAVDKETLGNNTVTFNGNTFGFPKYYYPYTNQPGYLPPFVVMQLKDFPQGKSARLICQLWAKNIIQDRQRRLGMTIIEVKSQE